MELVRLRYFYEVAQSASIRQAADRLHVTPSAVSRQIAALEHQFGADLLERSTQGVKLTPAGEILVEHLRLAFSQLREARAHIDDLTQLRRGEVIIQTIEGLIDDLLPKTVARVHAIYPGITCHVYTSSTDQIISSLIRGEADIGLALNAPERPEIVAVAEYREPLYAILAPHHPLASKTSIGWNDLQAFPACLPGPSFGVRRLVDESMRQAGAHLGQVYVTNSIQFTRSMARTGVTYTLMPKFALEHDLRDGYLVAIPINEPFLDEATIQVLCRRGRKLPHATVAVLDAIQASIVELRT